MSRSKDSSTFDSLQEYIDFMDANGLTELEYSVPKMSIRLSRAANAAPVTAATQVPVAAPSAQAATPAPTAEASTALHVIKSPFVGTFYRAPGPNQEPFVEEGKTVSMGDTLCIVEAMKLMNEIEADQKARIVKVLVKDATPVEFGEPLFEVEVL